MKINNNLYLINRANYYSDINQNRQRSVNPSQQKFCTPYIEHGVPYSLYNNTKPTDLNFKTGNAFWNLFAQDREVSNDESLLIAKDKSKRAIIYNYLDKKLDSSINEYKKGNNCIPDISINDLTLAKKTLQLLSVELNKSNNNLINSHDIAFTGRESCNKIIHSFSAACAGITAIVGEGTAAGIDIPFLIAAETIMFTALGSQLKAKPEAAILYAAKEFISGAFIGGTLLKGATALAAIAGEVLSIGTGSPLITGALRTVNSAISVGICEKMGWGFVNAVQNGTMNTKDQAIRFAAFVAAWGASEAITSGIDFLSDINIDDAKTLNDSLSSDTKKTIADIVKLASSNGTYSIAGRTITCFGSYFAETATRLKLEGKSIDSDIMKDLIISTIIAVAVGEVLSETIEGGTEKAAKTYAEKLAKDSNLLSVIDTKLLEKELLNKTRLSNEDLVSIASLADDIVPFMKNKLKGIQ